MSELLKKRLRESEGKTATIFLKNNFRYKGKVTGCDEEYLELLDFKTGQYKVIFLEQINDLEVEL